LQVYIPIQPGPMVPGRTDKRDPSSWSLISVVIHVFVFMVTWPWWIGAYKEIKDLEKTYEKNSIISNEPEGRGQ
jgi:hypothetical protein